LLLPLLVVHGLQTMLAGAAPGQTAADAEVLSRAKALLERADAPSALKILEKASRTVKKGDARSRADILKLKGYTLVLLRREAEAEATFRKLLLLFPGDEYGTLELAKRLHARNAFAESRRLYRRVLDRNPDHAGAREGLKRLERAEREYRDVAERVCSGERALLWLAGLTVIVLAGFGFLLAYLLFKRVPAE